MRDMEKLMMERIDTEGRIKKKFKEQDHHFVGLGCDNVEIDRTVRKAMSKLSGVKKLVKGLSDRFDEYERSKVFKDKKILKEELSGDGLPVPSGSQVRKPPAEPFARSAPTLRYDDLYVVARDAAAAATTSDIDDDDDDTVSMDSQPYEPHGSPHATMYWKYFEMNDNGYFDVLLVCWEFFYVVDYLYNESVEATIRAERERVQNEANRAGGPNAAPIARE
ncbi:hypothetical protein Tco_0823366 [Tanacetum coccineum]|uniref:Uncharacterized protein n=1 Tax=Tanacetum coccineum TaxID=301880 RepID=A0ABQ5AKP5_9ASTR